MSETISYYPSQAEDLVDQVDSFTNEIAREAFPKLDGQLMPLVAANANVIIRCPWMAGAEVPLGIAMINYPSLMTEEGADRIMAGVYELLANRVEQNQELDDEEVLEEPAEEAPAKDTKTDEPITMKTTPQKQTVRIKEEQEQQRNTSKNDSNELTAKPAGIKDSRPSSAVRVKPNQPKVVTDKTKTAGLAAKREENLKVEKATKPTPAPASLEALSQTTPKTESTKTESTKGSPIITLSSAEIISANSDAKPINHIEETKSAPVEAKPAVAQANKPAQPAVSSSERTIIPEDRERHFDDIEVAPESMNDHVGNEVPASSPEEIRLIIDRVPAPARLEFLDFESSTLVVDGIEPQDYEATTPPEPEALQETTDYQADINMPTEMLFAVDHSEEAQAVEVEPSSVDFGAELDLRPITETAIVERAEDTAEQLPRVEPIIQELEQTLAHLVEIVEASQPEATKEVNRILERIIKAPKNTEDITGDESEVENSIEAELEELFTELFKLLNIEYSPEIIEALAEQTIKYHSIDRIEKLIDDEGPEQSAGDIGTHEIIDLLLQSSNTNRRVFTEANLIGNFAIRLYTFKTFDFAIEYAKRYGLPRAA